MRYLVLMALLSITTSPVLAQNRLVLSNKVEARYNGFFISDKVSVTDNTITRNSLSIGAVSDINRRAQYKTFYTLQNSLKSQWTPEYILGFSFEYKFR